MRYLFRTQYQQDIALWRHNVDRFWYGLLEVLVLIAPAVLGEFYIGELGAVFIFAIAGVGLMLLVGYSGLISLGHAAFLGIGAYVNAVLLDRGVPFLVTLPLAGLFTALCGAAIGRPTLRMSGLYLAIATLAFGSIVGTVFQKWTAVTGGFDGFAVPTPTIFGIAIEGATGIYYVALAVLAFVLWVSANLLRYGHPSCPLQDTCLCRQRGDDRIGRSAFRPLRALSGARRIRRAALGAVCDHRVRGWPRVAARRDTRRDVCAVVTAVHRRRA
jgi:branched-chain amino acid transport system permease protein